VLACVGGDIAIVERAYRLIHALVIVGAAGVDGLVFTRVLVGVAHIPRALVVVRAFARCQTTPGSGHVSALAGGSIAGIGGTQVPIIAIRRSSACGACIRSCHGRVTRTTVRWLVASVVIASRPAALSSNAFRPPNECGTYTDHPDAFG
jgi:hypothetical protein